MTASNRSMFHGIWLPWVVLAAGLIVTFIAATGMKREVDEDENREFGFACSRICQKINSRVKTDERILISASALFDTADAISRDDWHAFVQRENLDRDLCGIRGIGFSQWIARGELAARIGEIRAQGFPDYTVTPAGDRAIYAAVIYIEPFSGRNMRMLGFDMYSDPVVSTAMELAMDSDKAVLSGNIALKSENGREDRTGVVMVVPVYRKGMKTATVRERHAALYGWVFGIYRMDDLMQSVLKEWDAVAGVRPRLQVFDKPDGSAGSLLYESSSGEKGAVESREALPMQAAFNGRIWYLHFTPVRGRLNYGGIYSVFSAGTAISLLLFGLLLSFRNTQFKAQQLADRLTAELKESEQSYRNQFTGNSAVMLLLDPGDGTIVDANDAASVFYGHSRQRLQSMRVTEINTLPAQDVLEAMASVPHWQGKRFEFCHRLADGTLKDVEVSASSIHFGGRNMIHSIVQDITERKNAAEMLRQSAARLNAITDAAQDAILMMDPDGNISFWNPAAERIFGYKSEEAVGRNLHGLISPARYHQAHDAAYPMFKETGRGATVGRTLDLEGCRKDGTEISVQLSLSSVLMPGGWHAVGILRDITDRKRAEAEIQEANLYLEEATARASHMAAQAELANAAKSEFLANMSHEIRTPLNGIIGMTGMMLDTDLNAEQRRYGEIVRSSGESLLNLINDILDFSKIEAKKLDLENLDFDLLSLMEDFSEMMAVRAQEKGLELICSVDLDVPASLRGDPGRLRQILTNLVGNAVKFTPSGEVEVRVLQAAAGGAAAAPETEVLLRFSVRDTGIGIPEDKIDDLFDKFSQADASITRKYGGTGLGLAISRQLAELMGGTAGVSSEEGKGSEFWFTARLSRQTVKENGDNALPADLNGVRVLIVDDSAANREILSNRLAVWGMRTSEAASGPEALLALNEALSGNDPFRVAVIDMRMPDMDGKMLGWTIRADARLAAARMVMMTSIGVRGEARELKEIGFSAYVTKPIRFPELKAILSSTLAGEDPSIRPRFETRHSIRERRGALAAVRTRILLAEDNPTNQLVAMGILKKLGFQADVAANGLEALDALKCQPYDLVLMDVQMPVMDGLEAARRIRRSDIADPQIPIIAMTAHAMQGDRERCLAVGMNDYVTKPIRPDVLDEVLNRWLHQGSRKAGIQNPGSEIGEPPAPEAADSPPARTPEPHPPVFDRDGLMNRMMGDAEMIRIVLDCFLEDIPIQIAALKACIESADIQGARRQAHTIKGASANVGGERLRKVSLEIEKAAEAGDLSAAGKRIPELEAQFALLRREMT